MAQQDQTPKPSQWPRERWKRDRAAEVYRLLVQWGRERLAREEAERQTQENGATEDNGKPLEPNNTVSNACYIAES